MGRKLIICVFLLTYAANAQYEGGSNDGNDWSTLTGSRLNGAIASFSVLYQGSWGEGFDHQEVQLLLSNSNFTIYDGNLGDGFSKSIASLTLSGNNVGNLYMGTAGDGFSKDLLQSTPEGKAIAILFSGNSGDGANNSSRFGFLLEGFVSDLFGGGNGDGFANVLKPDNYLTGVILALFNGGSGDGFSNMGYITAFTLDLVKKLKDLELVLYPNPATDIVNLKLPSSIRITKIEIIDINGKPVKVQHINSLSIDVSNLSSGLYLVNIFVENKKATQKLIIR